MDLKEADILPRDPTGRYFPGALHHIHQTTFRSAPLALPGTTHLVEMKYFEGVELLRVYLAGGEEPYCSLRHLEFVLRQPDLVAFMKSLGVRLKTITVKDTGILPGIINLRSLVYEDEPVLIKWKAAESILKRIGLTPRAPEVDVEKPEYISAETTKAPESDPAAEEEITSSTPTARSKGQRGTQSVGVDAAMGERLERIRIS